MLTNENCRQVTILDSHTGKESCLLFFPLSSTCLMRRPPALYVEMLGKYVSIDQQYIFIIATQNNFCKENSCSDIE